MCASIAGGAFTPSGDIITLMVWQKAKRANNTDLVRNSLKQIERLEWDTLLFFFEHQTVN